MKYGVDAVLHANDLNCEDFVKQYSMAVMEAFL